jgi:hypothetical protein
VAQLGIGFESIGPSVLRRLFSLINDKHFEVRSPKLQRQPKLLGDCSGHFRSQIVYRDSGVGAWQIECRTMPVVRYSASPGAELMRSLEGVVLVDPE